MPTGDFNAAKTHCPKGHEYTPENTKLRRGSRECKACARLRANHANRRLGIWKKGSIWNHIVRDPETDCWEWTGFRWRGYGRTSRSGIQVDAHRLVWNELRGEAIGLDLHHTCDNKGCVNHRHLIPLTHSEHMMEHWRG